MSRRTTPANPAPKTPAKGTPEPLPPPPENAMDRLARWWLHFDRFGWDVLGVILVAAAMITLIGLFKLTTGALISPWVILLERWFGWGRYLMVVALCGMGLLALRRKAVQSQRFRLGRVVALELAVFALLALFALFGGMSLARSEIGLDGGVVGWGLAMMTQMLLPDPFPVLLWGLAFILCVGWGSGLFHRLGLWLDVWLAPAAAEAALLEIENAPKAQPVPAAVAVQAAPTKEKRPQSVKAPPAEKEKPGVVRPRDERLPPLSLLSAEQPVNPDESQIHETALLIEKTLAEFGIPARVIGFRVGPTVTQYAVEPGYMDKTGPDGEPTQQKVRVAQIAALERDLALALSAEHIRIEAPVPGESFVGIEVPNPHSALVCLRPLLESKPFIKLGSPLAVALGRDVSGQPVVADLARMPHLLIAGTTGSGKSICIEALTACLIMSNTPEQLRLVMLDPKMVELVRFNGLPHLLGKVETELDRMLAVLSWALVEMDNRYKLLESMHARDLDAFNEKMAKRKLPGLPRIVIMVDELAELMMHSPDQTEHCLVRLAQMARATGMHMIIATQRPSVDVVTGLIKANFPARLSFNVASSIDSRVILDTNGAESLLGKGDMLFLNPESGSPMRAQGALVTDAEIEQVVNFWRKSGVEAGEKTGTAPWEELVDDGEDDTDQLVKQAIELVKHSRRASASLLQRRLRIGYPRAARLLDELEALGVVGPAQGGGREREVIISADEDMNGVGLAGEDDEEN